MESNINSPVSHNDSQSNFNDSRVIANDSRVICNDSRVNCNDSRVIENDSWELAGGKLRPLRDSRQDISVVGNQEENKDVKENKADCHIVLINLLFSLLFS